MEIKTITLHFGEPDVDESRNLVGTFSAEASCFVCAGSYLLPETEEIY